MTRSSSIVAVSLTVALLLATASGCGSKGEESTGSSGSSEGSIKTGPGITDKTITLRKSAGVEVRVKPGSRRFPRGFTLTQSFQMLSGTLGSQAVQGRLRGNEITLTAGNQKWTGMVDGNTIKFTSPSAMTATKK